MATGTVGEYHEMIEQLMLTAESLGRYGDIEGRKLVSGIVEKMYLAQMGVLEEAKALGNAESIEKYIVPGYAYIKDWLEGKITFSEDEDEDD